MSRETAEQIGRMNAEMAWDQRYDYDDAMHAFDTYRDNVRDTLREQGLTVFEVFAYYAFDMRQAAFTAR